MEEKKTPFDQYPWLWRFTTPGEANIKEACVSLKVMATIDDWEDEKWDVLNQQLCNTRSNDPKIEWWLKRKTKLGRPDFLPMKPKKDMKDTSTVDINKVGEFLFLELFTEELANIKALVAITRAERQLDQIRVFIVDNTYAFNMRLLSWARERALQKTQ